MTEIQRIKAINKVEETLIAQGVTYEKNKSEFCEGEVIVFDFFVPEQTVIRDGKEVHVKGGMIDITE